MGSLTLAPPSACNAGDLDSIPGLGRSPGGGQGNPLTVLLLENPCGQRSLAGTVSRVAKTQTRLSKHNTQATNSMMAAANLIQGQESQLLNFQEFCKPVIKHRHYQKLSYVNSQWNKPYWKTLNSLILILWYFTSISPLQDIYMYLSDGKL